MGTRESQHHTAGLCRAHHRAKVVLSEDPLEGDLLGRVARDGGVDSCVDSEETLTQGGIRWRLHNEYVDKRHPTSGRGIDNSDATAGQTGIDRKDAHWRELVLLELGENFVADVKIAVDVLNVVAVFQRFDDAEHLAGRLGVNLHFEIGHEL